MRSNDESVPDGMERKAKDRYEVVGIAILDSKHRILSQGGGIPWVISDDRSRFRSLTYGHPVVMGRKTWESLPSRPLRGRTNIVLSRREQTLPGAVVVHTAAQALAYALKSPGSEEVYIIGGGETFRAFWPFITRLELTVVYAEMPLQKGEVVVFPPYEHTFSCVVKREERICGSIPYAFLTLRKSHCTTPPLREETLDGVEG